MKDAIKIILGFAIFFTVVILIGSAIGCGEPEARLTTLDELRGQDIDTLVLQPAALKVIPGRDWLTDSVGAIEQYGFYLLNQDFTNTRETIISSDTLLAWLRDSISGGGSQTLTYSNDSLYISGGNAIVITGFADTTEVNEVTEYINTLLAPAVQVNIDNIEDLQDSIAAHRTDINAGGGSSVTVSGAYDYLTLSGQDLIRGQVNLATDVTGVLSQANFDTTGLSGSGGGSSKWSESGADIYRSSGYVGILNSNPDYIFDIGDVVDNTVVTDPSIVMRRDLRGSLQSGHGITDATIWSGPTGGAYAYNSYDSHVKFTGNKYFDHYAHDQSRFIMEDTVKLDKHYGFWLLATQNSIDTLFENYGVFLDNIGGTGPVKDNYGIYVDEINRGYRRNYAIQTKDGDIRFEQIRTSGDDNMLILERDAFSANEKMKISYRVNNNEYGYISTSLASSTDSYLSFGTKNASVGERMRIDKDGKVIVYGGKVDLDAVNLVGDDYYLRSNKGLSIENGSERITLMHPSGGFLEGAGNPATGAIEITFPTGAATGDMVSGEVDVYVWEADKSFRVLFKGYLNNLAWTNCTATVLATGESYLHQVRFGDDGSNAKIWIGELATTWKFPQIHLNEVSASFNGTYAEWDGNFSIAIEASAFDNVDQTVSNASPYMKPLFPDATEITLGTIKIITGSGTPESSVTAPIGSMYTRTDGGSGTTLYIKESGVGNTGWVAK